MFQFFSDLKEQVNLFYTVVEYFFYFLIGFLCLILLKFAKKIILLLVEFSNKFNNKENFLYFLKRLASIFLFIIISILIGKVVLFVI